MSSGRTREVVGASQPRHWSGWDVVDRVFHSSSWPGITGASPECCNKSKLTEKAKTRADRGAGRLALGAANRASLIGARNSKRRRPSG